MISVDFALINVIAICDYHFLSLGDLLEWILYSRVPSERFEGYRWLFSVFHLFSSKSC